MHSAYPAYRIHPQCVLMDVFDFGPVYPFL